MTLLFRYILGRHTQLMLLTMAVGLALYLLTELVERLDLFVEAEVGLGTIVLYFAVRLPAIAAQILPAVFILASIITLSLLARNRESLALEAGGVSPGTLTTVLLICGVLWGGIQLGISQFLGASGTAIAEDIWINDVRKAQGFERSAYDVWFTDEDRIVSFLLLTPEGEGTSLTSYELSEDGLHFESIITAAHFRPAAGAWHLLDVTRVSPAAYTTETLPELVLPISHAPDVFFVGFQDNPQNLPLGQLSQAIDVLGGSGSNVEGLQTAWHSRLAYAASLVVMAALAAAVASWQRNIYIAVGISILICFFYYMFTIVGVSMGEKGILPPMAAAWGPQLILLLIATARLYYVSVRR